MGKRGPTKTPTKMLQARGSWRGTVRDGEPEVEGAPIAPDWLTEDAFKIWDQVAPRLTAMGVAGSVDSNAIGRYCALFARWLDCEAFIRDNGQFSDDGKEYAQVGRASRLSDQLLKLEQQYGMTASARAGMAIDTGKKPKDQDGISRFINPKLVG